MNKIIQKLLRSISNNKSPTLTVVGVGPGDPSLLTLGALRAIKKANNIFFPVSAIDGKSYAAEIVKKYIRFKKKIPVLFPMAKEELNPDQIWEDAARKIISCLNRDNYAVLLCLGDISLFASSSYLINKIKKLKPEILIKNEPGISSLSAAAAYANYDLIKKGEILKILECPNSSKKLINLIHEEINSKKVIALFKVGKRWSWVKEILKEEKLLNKALLASNIGLYDQFIDIASKYKSDDLPYFSLLIMRLN
tara:strand:- start:16 stop:771 length:756 start_codon:yes stop_codon:yes gene_type:complete